MSTKGQYRGGNLVFYDGSSHESMPIAPSVFSDDFIGAGSVVIPAAASEESGVPWAKKIVGAAPPTVAGVADAANGHIQCALTADSQKQDAALYMGDYRNFSLLQGCVFEARVKVSVLPTLLAETIIGLVGDWADGPDAITHSAFFTHDGSGEAICEVDDAATDQSATSGVTVLATEWHTYRIEFVSLTDIRFYIDGNRVAGGTTFAYAAVGADAVLQPYIGLYKASGAGVGTLLVDYVRVWQNRS